MVFIALFSGCYYRGCACRGERFHDHDHGHEFHDHDRR
jgi:hypothetical protein